MTTLYKLMSIAPAMTRKTVPVGNDRWNVAGSFVIERMMMKRRTTTDEIIVIWNFNAHTSIPFCLLAESLLCSA